MTGVQTCALPIWRFVVGSLVALVVAAKVKAFEKMVLMKELYPFFSLMRAIQIEFGLFENFVDRACEIFTSSFLLYFPFWVPGILSLLRYFPFRLLIFFFVLAIVTGSPDCSILATEVETGSAIARLENSHG